MKRRWDQLALHAILILILTLTLAPFVFVIDNSMRTNSEMYHAFFGLPRLSQQMFAAYANAWEVLRPYTLNTIFVCVVTGVGVVLVGSVSAYVFSRCQFKGRELLLLAVLAFMMIPGVLTLVPSFLWVKKLGLLNSHWVLILPYLAGGQVFAIFLFKSFFDGLPSELFESARMDGAGHFTLYWKMVLPLSKSVIAVVGIVNILGTWNNFLWPFITNSDAKYHVISSGLYLMNQSNVASNFATMFAAYVLASIPLLILFLYATKPFMQGVTSGAFKA